VPLLSVENLTRYFGGLAAVSKVGLDVPRGGLHGLIGPNGAGKTTVFNLITGIYHPSDGQITFEDQSIVGLEPYRITGLGIARTFQNIRLFGDLTVLDNVRIAYHCRVGYSVADAVLRTNRYRREEQSLTQEAREFLAVFGLHDRQYELARSLPYGEQRRLEIARALASHPKLLLLDEPAAGMNPAEVRQLMRLIEFIRTRFSVTILLIEHQMGLVMGVCEHITVMDFGQVLARGTPREVQDNPAVIEAYLGSAVA
jgi:branched-chain amino acid transport system ATP-binding protein